MPPGSVVWSAIVRLRRSVLVERWWSLRAARSRPGFGTLSRLNSGPPVPQAVVGPAANEAPVDRSHRENTSRTLLPKLLPNSLARGGMKQGGEAREVEKVPTRR